MNNSQKQNQIKKNWKIYGGGGKQEKSQWRLKIKSQFLISNKSEFQVSPGVSYPDSILFI